jgi:hypothetical protein
MKKNHIEMLKDREFNNYQWQDLVSCTYTSNIIVSTFSFFT